MKPVEIKKDIFWVGCVDYDHRDFHGYSTSPEGTTYNAYVIRDEKNVLFDTVSIGKAGTLLCRLAKIMDPEKIDYLVINHLELDHAGCLAEVVERCRPEKIFCSTMGLKSMQGHFPQSRDWPVQAVKSGDTISIGKRTIVFQETRMLHWPDSMVSYIPEDRLLISQDAFGQNIASSERFVDEFDHADFVRRVEEYYNNIVLPYSPQVLAAIPVLGSLDIDMIAPDHGLIHRGKDDVAFIVNKYREMAEQKPQKRAVIFYDTMWHSTEKLAYAACGGLEELGIPTRIMSVKQNHHSAIMSEVGRCGVVLAGCPTHNNGILPLMAAQLAYIKGLRPKNRVAGAFGSYGWSGEGAREIARCFQEMGWEMAGDPVRCNWKPGHEALKAAHDLGRAAGEALLRKLGR